MQCVQQLYWIDWQENYKKTQGGSGVGVWKLGWLVPLWSEIRVNYIDLFFNICFLGLIVVNNPYIRHLVTKFWLIDSWPVPFYYLIPYVHIIFYCQVLIVSITPVNKKFPSLKVLYFSNFEAWFRIRKYFLAYDPVLAELPVLRFFGRKLHFWKYFEILKKIKLFFF